MRSNPSKTGACAAQDACIACCQLDLNNMAVPSWLFPLRDVMFIGAIPADYRHSAAPKREQQTSLQVYPGAVICEFRADFTKRYDEAHGYAKEYKTSPCVGQAIGTRISGTSGTSGTPGIWGPR